MYRYSPSTTSKRAERAGPSGAGAGAEAEADAEGGSGAGAEELPELYRPGEWLTAVAPRKAPYHPQMGDVCLYFRLVGTRCALLYTYQSGWRLIDNCLCF